MESIDALAKAVNEFEGGMVLVSHDMRLISQVAKEIWICDNKTISPYRGDIMNFKMDMRKQMGIDGDGGNSGAKLLRGDASVKASDKPKERVKTVEKVPKLEVLKPGLKISSVNDVSGGTKIESTPLPLLADDSTTVTATTAISTGSSTTVSAENGAAPQKYIPPHLRKKMSQQQVD
jgi:energy-coupling factor transporter ATP-binding protein EcfA2